MSQSEQWEEYKKSPDAELFKIQQENPVILEEFEKSIKGIEVESHNILRDYLCFKWGFMAASWRSAKTLGLLL